MKVQIAKYFVCSLHICQIDFIACRLYALFRKSSYRFQLQYYHSPFRLPIEKVPDLGRVVFKNIKC